MSKYGLPFEVIPAKAKEIAPDGLCPEEYVRILAQNKAAEVFGSSNEPDAVFIAADTIVEKDGIIFGKPASDDAAADMLRSLSGNKHNVWTGICVRQGDRIITAAEKTEVCFRPLTEKEILAYVATGEPGDKAGAYGYQGLAGIFVKEIHGDFFNVVGLPLCLLNEMLAQFGITLLK